MARDYKLEIHRDSVNAVLYFHDDDTVELVDADTGEHIDYLLKKLVIVDDMVKWMRKYDVQNLECSKVV